MMTKTIRIIDLLVLIANEECDKLPKKIKICGTIMNFDEEYQDYNYRDNWFLEDFNFYHSLNNELEIIEEQPKTIEKFNIINTLVGTFVVDRNDKKHFDVFEIEMAEKINWLIDKVSEK